MMAAVLGWTGTAGTFMAYLLLWRGRLGSESIVYALMNAVGGLLAGIASALYGAWPSAASNLVWAAIGLQSTLVALRRRVRAASPLSARAGTIAMTDPVAECLV